MHASHIRSAHFTNPQGQNEQIGWPRGQKRPQDIEFAHPAIPRTQNEQIQCLELPTDPYQTHRGHHVTSHTSDPLTLQTHEARMSKSAVLQPKNGRKTSNLLILRFHAHRMSKSDVSGCVRLHQEMSTRYAISASLPLLGMIFTRKPLPVCSMRVDTITERGCEPHSSVPLLTLFPTMNSISNVPAPMHDVVRE